LEPSEFDLSLAQPVSHSTRSHSADVTIQLSVNGISLPVAQLGPDFLLLDAVADHPGLCVLCAFVVNGTPLAASSFERRVLRHGQTFLEYRY
jgi:hypothetical protein